MDVPLEPIIEQSSFRVAANESIVSQAETWEEVQVRIEAYLRAWRFPYNFENLAEILRTAKERAKKESASRMEIAIEETDEFIGSRLRETIVGSTDGAERRLCLFVAGENAFTNPTVYREAKEKIRLAFHPQRPLETHPMTMRTTLSHLPSFRLIAGWCAFVILLVLVFIFTHR